MLEAYCAINLLSGKLSVSEQEKDFKASVAIGIELSQILNLPRFIFHEVGTFSSREIIFHHFLVSHFLEERKCN